MSLSNHGKGAILKASSVFADFSVEFPQKKQGDLIFPKNYGNKQQILVVEGLHLYLSD